MLAHVRSAERSCTLASTTMKHASHAIIIFVGGGLGSVARWLLGRCITEMLPARIHIFPFGILACNVLGCFLIGLFFGCLPIFKPEEVWRSLLVTGFLGGFTTFSTFAEDTHRLFTHGPATGAALNIVASIVLCLIGVALGHKLASGFS
jgi:CrcB protein